MPQGLFSQFGQQFENYDGRRVQAGFVEDQTLLDNITHAVQEGIIGALGWEVRPARIIYVFILHFLYTNRTWNSACILFCLKSLFYYVALLIASNMLLVYTMFLIISSHTGIV